MMNAYRNAAKAWMDIKVTLTALLAKMCAGTRSLVSASHRGMVSRPRTTVGLLAVNLPAANSVKLLRPIGIAMFVILVGPLLQSDSRVSAQTCFTCSFECPFGAGFYCEPNGPQGGDTEPCWLRVYELQNPIDPEEEGTGGCLCVPQGDPCHGGDEGGSAMADRMTDLRQATDVLAAGHMLPSDGPLYVGVTAKELVIRWKCSGSVAARVAIADVPLPVSGALAG